MHVWMPPVATAGVGGTSLVERVSSSRIAEDSATYERQRSASSGDIDAVGRYFGTVTATTLAIPEKVTIARYVSEHDAEFSKS